MIIINWWKKLLLNLFFICIFRGIKLPAVQSQLAKRGGAATRGRRGCGGCGSKASFTNVKQEQESENEDPLGSEPGSEETEDKKVKESEKRKPTARRGKRFTAGQAPDRSSKVPEVIDCSVELSEIEGDAKKRKIKKHTGSKKLESDIEIIEEEKKEEKLQPKKKANGSRKIEVKKTAEKNRVEDKSDEKKNKKGTEEIKKSDAVEVPPSNIETEVVSDGMHLETVAAYVNDVNDAELPIPQP